MDKIGERILLARSTLGWSQDRLAEKINSLAGETVRKVERAQVSKWERGIQTPRRSTQFRIAQALGVRYEWIRTGDGAVTADRLESRMRLSTDGMGTRIRLAREARGLTQVQLGAKINPSVDQTYISRWERNEIIPRANTRFQIAQALCIRPEWLHDGEGSMYLKCNQDEESLVLEHKRILGALIAFIDDGGGTFRKLLPYLGTDYGTAYEEGWMGFTNALSDHEDRILGKPIDTLLE